MPIEDRDEIQAKNDAPQDRARRRLIKLGIYLTPAVVSMTTFLRRADARPSDTPNVTPGSNVNQNVNPDAQITINPQ